MGMNDIIRRGTLGTVTWTLHEDGELHFAPTDGVSGTLRTYHDYDRIDTPWAPYRDRITSVTSEGEIIIGESLNSFFEGCAALTDVDLTGWTIEPGRTDMRGMFSNSFRDCVSLKEIDLTPLGEWDTSAVTDMSWMFSNSFRGCVSLKEIDLTPLENRDISAAWDDYQ